LLWYLECKGYGIVSRREVFLLKGEAGGSEVDDLSLGFSFVMSLNCLSLSVDILVFSHLIHESTFFFSFHLQVNMLDLQIVECSEINCSLNELSRVIKGFERLQEDMTGVML